jgi:transketolase
MSTYLQQVAHRMRLETFKAIAGAGGGHFGGSLSEIEILTALWFRVLQVDPSNPQWDGRDRFILSKGHGGPGLYVMLAERGFFPKSWLAELDQSGGRLPKHVDFGIPGIDISSGSLGQGLSVAVGMALASRVDGSDRRIYVVMGDGECDEGQVWEAAMAAAKYGLDSVTAIIDRNRVQVDGTCAEIMPNDPFLDKWRAFGWHVLHVDGHDVDAIVAALKTASTTVGKPTMIVADTVKGKGVSFMEGQAKWHSGSVSREQYETAVAELSKELTK